MNLDFTGKIEQNVSLTKDTNLSGMIIGNVIVNKGISFILSGMVIGNVTVEKGGNLTMPGTVIGKIINKGGNVVKTGMVTDSIDNPRSR